MYLEAFLSDLRSQTAEKPHKHKNSCHLKENGRSFCFLCHLRLQFSVIWVC